MTPEELADAFDAGAGRAGDLHRVLDAFVDVMNVSVQKNFADEGRPTPWEPTRYPNSHRNHVRTLEDEGTLKRSAKAIRDGNDVILVAGGGGQPEAKAPALQYGAQLHNKRRTTTGRFVTRRSWKNTVSFGGQLPPRPYLLFQPEDLAYLGDELPSWIFMGVRFLR